MLPKITMSQELPDDTGTGLPSTSMQFVVPWKVGTGSEGLGTFSLINVPVGGGLRVKTVPVTSATLLSSPDDPYPRDHEAFSARVGPGRGKVDADTARVEDRHDLCRDEVRGARIEIPKEQVAGRDEHPGGEGGKAVHSRQGRQDSRDRLAGVVGTVPTHCTAGKRAD